MIKMTNEGMDSKPQQRIQHSTTELEVTALAIKAFVVYPRVEK